MTIQPIPGSFRDPAGRVYATEGRIVRAVQEDAARNLQKVIESGFFKHRIADGQIIGFDAVPGPGDRPPATDHVQLFEHPRLPFISYPYEWSFEALRCAALHHLRIHLEAIASGVTLCDASAYNVQFIGAKPIFIDLLSFVPYRAGEFWKGYGQFCQQFLNPLLL